MEEISLTAKQRLTLLTKLITLSLPPDQELIRDLGDGTVDNKKNDTTNAPTIDGTNQAESTAAVINNSGMVIGSTYFYVDVTPPVNQGDPSQITFSDLALARLDKGPPSSRFTGPTVTPTTMNNAGDIAGHIGSIGGNCALWTGGTNVLLPFFHYPYDVNQDKYVAGAQWQPNNRYPLVWHDTETKYLPTPFNTKDAEVYSINKDGIMVGYAYSNAGDYSAMLWQNGTYYNMNSQLNAAAVAAGYTVSTLWAVNDHGTICASASKPGWAGLVLLVPDPAVQLITPGGDPLNAPVDTAVDGQNEFTFNSANPGVLSIHFKAKVLAPGTAAALASRCRFSIDNIPGSTLDWAQANPNGQPTNPSGDFLEADATLTGLPTSNSGFGRKNVTITVDGALRDQKAIEVFYLAKEYNHSGGNAAEPNWFYYYKQNAGGGIYSYDPTPGARSSSVAGGGDISIKIGDYVHSPGGDFITTSIVNGQLTATGISSTNMFYAHFLGVLAHERQHANNETTSGPPDDLDSDFLSNTFETTTSKTNPDDKYSASRALGWSVDDGEVYAGGVVEEIGVRTADTGQDWAKPGTNSK